MQVLYIRPRFVRRLLWMTFLAGLSCLVLSWTPLPARANGDIAGSLATPPDPTVRRVSGISDTQNQPVFLGNLDCTSLTYHLTDSTNMQSGCFTSTAFGMLDGDSETVIYNGTDEGVRLYPSSANQVLEPWPGTLNTVALDAATTGGSYLSLYKELPTVRQYRDALGRISSEQLVDPPDTSLKDATGQRLVVNPQTMAFSAGGSWMVVEDYNNSFVRINLATLAMTAFAPAFNNPISQSSQVAVSDDGRFVAIENPSNNVFKIYDLSTCDGVANNLQPQKCQAYDYWQLAHGQITGLKAIWHIRFLDDGLLSFEATAGDASASGLYELSPSAGDASLTTYLGLGDSYTSGEGAFDYMTGTDTEANECHLSAHSYPLLLTRDLFGAAGGHSVACSGAVIDDIGSNSASYHGQVKNGASYGDLESSGELANIEAAFSPGSIAQRRFVAHYQPRIITVSVGGNDIGFGDILQNCVEPHISLHITNQDCYDAYESRQALLNLIDRTTSRWTSLYRQLQADDPLGRIYAIGYPSIADSTGRCGLNVRLSAKELAFANELINYLDGDIQDAAQAAGVSYVDISHALDGHRLCEAAGYDIAMNGLTAGNDAGFAGIDVFGHESYHPNSLGQQLIEQSILKQTDDLSTGATTASQDTAQKLLDAPKSGSPVYTFVPDDKLANPLVKVGSVVEVHASGSDDGLEPDSSYSVRLGGPTGPIVATAPSDSNGDIRTSFIDVASTVIGGSTLDITGTNEVGEPVDVSQPIYVVSNTGDSDGDGIADQRDSCPYAVNSGQDTDHDGIDDICDPLIGLAGSGSDPPALEPPSAPQQAGLTSQLQLAKLTTSVEAPTGESRGEVLGARTIGLEAPGLKSPQSGRPRNYKPATNRVPLAPLLIVMITLVPVLIAGLHNIARRRRR
jgi:hypothetical protein